MGQLRFIDPPLIHEHTGAACQVAKNNGVPHVHQHAVSAAHVAGTQPKMGSFFRADDGHKLAKAGRGVWGGLIQTNQLGHPLRLGRAGGTFTEIEF